MPQFLLLTIAIIVYGSLYPFHFESTARAANPWLAVWHGWPHEWNRFVLRDVLLNVVLYAPLGLAAAMVSLRRHSRSFSAAAAIALAFALSASMELVQAYTPDRDPSSLDVLTNVAGGALGAMVALLCWRTLRDLTAAGTRALRGAGVILLAVWAIYEFYPLFPDIGRAHLYRSLYGLLHARDLPVLETWLGVAEWFAAGLALESVFRKMRTAWLASLMVFSLAAHAIIADRTPSRERSGRRRHRSGLSGVFRRKRRAQPGARACSARRFCCANCSRSICSPSRGPFPGFRSPPRWNRSAMAP